MTDNAPADPRRYVPASLSEIYDLLAVLIGNAPRFDNPSDAFLSHNIDTRFQQLVDGFGKVRKKLGEERYAALIDRADRAKALFVEDPDDTNGKTDQGIALIHEIEGIVQSTRRRRVVAKLTDEDGEVTGD